MNVVTEAPAEAVALNRRIRELDSAIAFYLELARARELDEVVATALDGVRAVLGAEASGLFLVDPAGAVTTAAHRGLSDELVNALAHRPAGEGLVGQVVASGRPVVLDRAAADAAVPTAGFGWSLWMPLAARERTLGTLGVANRQAGPFAPAAVEQLAVLARVVALAVERALAFRDLRVEMQAQAQREQRDRLAAIGQLTGGLARELTNPLTAVCGYADLLLAGHAPDPHRALQIIAAEGNRCRRIAEGLLGFSRLGSGVRQSAQVNELVGRALDLADPQFRLDRIEVRRQLGDGLPPVSCDPQALLEVFTNLLANARHALVQREGPRLVSVYSERLQGAVRVLVHDNGPAIPPEERARLFEPLSVTQPQGRESILALTLCSSIVRDHGGRISVESGPADGATVIVELPTG